MLKNAHNYALLAAVAIIIVFLLKFITPLVFAALLAYLLWPVHQKLSTKTNKIASAGLLTIFVFLVFGFITFTGANFILNESANAYTFFSKVDFEKILPGEDGVASDFKDLTRFIFTNVISYMSNLVKEIPVLILNFFVFLGTLFYLIMDGEKLISWLRKNIPWDKKEKEVYIKEVKKYTDTFLKVWLIIAALQGTATTIGFMLFGLPYAILAGFLAAILSFLPIVGPYFLYLPVAGTLILFNKLSAGIGILIYGLIIGSALDYLVRPHYAGKWSQIHPLIILIGTLSGIALLGPSGLIVGPILLFSSTLMIKTAIEHHKVKA